MWPLQHPCPQQQQQQQQSPLPQQYTAGDSSQCTQCTVYDRLPSQFHQLLSMYCAPSTNPLNTGNISHTTTEASVNRTSNEVSLTTTTTTSSSSSTASSNIQYILAFSCSKSRADLLQKQENSSSTNEAPLYRLASDGSTVQLTVQYNFNGGTGKAADVKQVGHTAGGDSVSLAVASGRVLLELKPAHDERQTLKENDAATPAVWSAEARVYRVSVVSSAAAAASALVAGQAATRGGQQQQQQQQPGYNHGVASSSKGQHSVRHKRQRKQPQQQQQHVAAPAYWKGASAGGLQGCVSLYVFPGQLLSKGAPQEEQQLITELHNLLPELAGSSSSSSSSSYCLPPVFDADAYTNRCELRLA
jgi:hypothetical protein